ncbi:50S ribosomal protein L2, chloroplastic-like [Gossypium arboreum]|uniref:50S ribosomal protein L2, chloroplastic-like n=1 Tax=Gossypium arboreum TaxID=29729 RepID=UPI0022F154C1|nr:50S ribosomal protein L2, chloroplastic-like [Gossypium arboreum]
MAEWLKRPTHNWRIRRFNSYWMHANGTLNKSIGIGSVSMESHHLYITNWCGSTRTEIKHWVELFFGVKGGQLARAAGAVAETDCKRRKSATLKLPSGEVRLISKNCSATVGQVGNVGVNQKSLGRAGSKCWLGKRPVVRGVVMNPVDHPHEIGEGGAQLVEKTRNLWGYPALGRRSRKRNKYSDNLILRRRSK